MPRGVGDSRGGGVRALAGGELPIAMPVLATFAATASDPRRGVVAFATAGAALEEALPRGSRRIGGEHRVGGGVVCRRTVVELPVRGRGVMVEVELQRSAVLGAALAERGVELWAGMAAADRVRRKACSPSGAEALRILAGTAVSAIVPGGLRTGILLLLDSKLGDEAMLLLLIAVGGMVMVSPGCTRCLGAFSEASLEHPLVTSLTTDNGFLSKLSALALGSCNPCSSRSAQRIFSCTKSSS